MKHTIIVILIINSLMSFGQIEFKNNLALDTNSFTINPNPFVDTTIFHFEINSNDTVRLRIFNRWGNVIATLIDNETLQAGVYNYPYINDTLLNGIYYVLLEVNEDGFTDQLFKVDSINSVEEILQNDIFKFYPNPANDFIKISFNNNSKREIRLINQTGQLVFYNEVFDKNFKMNIENLKNGIYFISIKSKNSITTEKILIE